MHRHSQRSNATQNHKPAAPAKDPRPLAPSTRRLLDVIRERHEASRRELADTRARLQTSQRDLVAAERALATAPPIARADAATRSARIAREVEHLERAAYAAARVIGEYDRLVEAAKALDAPGAVQQSLLAERACTSCAGTGKDGIEPCRRCWGRRVVKVGGRK